MNNTEKGSFDNKRVLISGGGTGIGRATALAFANEGARVRVVGQFSETLKEVASHYPDRIEILCCDIRETNRWRDAIAQEKVDIIVNNAAICAKTDVLDNGDPSWGELFAVNFEAVLNGCREAAKYMAGNGGGRIINISSIHGRMCERGSAAYSVAKAAVDQLTRCLAVELAADHILVNAIAPGFVDTPMSRALGVNELDTDWFRDRFLASGRIPLGRAAQADEIANVVLFLASDKSTYMTGQVLEVDGGLTLTL